jgi:hypothetical protein
MFGSGKKIISIYKKLGEKYSLNVFTEKGTDGSPRAEGLYRNRNVKIESIVKDSLNGKKMVPHTALTVECENPDNFSFITVKRNKQNNAEYLAGSTQLGESEFDKKFIICTNNPEKLKGIFDFNTRFKLSHVHSLGFEGLITLRGNELQYIENGFLKNEESLMRTELVMHELCDIAEIMNYN